MSWWRDILRQSVFMCFFIIPIPIGAYTIHSGSSAVVAMVSYVFLSLVIPVAYVGCQDASFGPQGGGSAAGSWPSCGSSSLRLSGAFTAFMGVYWKAAPFWEWPTIGRDVVFIAGMYGEISLTMLLAFVVSQLLPGRKEVK